MDALFSVAPEGAEQARPIKHTMAGPECQARRAKKGRSHALCRPRLTIYGLSTAPRARAPGPRTGGGAAGRPAKSRTQRGAEGHLEQARCSPEAPAGTAGRGGAGENPGPPQTPRRSEARARRRARAGTARGRGRKAGRQPGTAPGLEAPGPEARRDGQGGTRRGHALATADPEQRKGDRQEARTGADGTAKPDGASERGRSAQARTTPERESRGEWPGPGEGERSEGARRRTRPAKRARARRPDREPRGGRGPGATGARAWPNKRAHLLWRGHRRAPSRATRVGPWWPRVPGRMPPGGAREPAKRSEARGGPQAP